MIYLDIKVKRIFSILTTIAIAMAVALPLDAALVWRDVQRDVNVPSLTDPNQTDGIEIFATDGSIIVRTPHKVQVRVFTILGQLVSQATVGPGTSELKMSARGIYVVKIGNVTQKVAL